MTNLNQRPPIGGDPSPQEGPAPSGSAPEPGATIDLKHILRSVLSGNPFFLVSAATMLYGLYLVAVDPEMIQAELSKLWFNVSSLEIYELMIVGTALLLARRKIWHDCNLLITLENMFMFVPFILISQATLFDDGNTPLQVQPMLNDASIWAVSGVACALACGKLLGLRQVAILRIPIGAVGFGIALVALNIVLPLYYRNGIAQDAAMWRDTSPLMWFAVLPLAVIAASLLPNLGAPDKPALLSHRNWPRVIPLIWIAATAVHLRTLDYLDDIAFSLRHIAPLAWMTAWVAFLKADDFTKAPSTRLQAILLTAPLMFAFVAASPAGANVFAALMTLNAVAFLALGMSNQSRSLAFHFATVAFIATIAALPHHLLDFAVPNFSREKMILLANGAYLLTLATLMRRPGWSVFASALFGFGIARYIQYLDYLGLYAIQAGLLFLLIHSLCWKTRGREGWSVRTAAAVALIAHSFIWGNIVNFRVTDIHVGLTIMLAGLLLIGAWFISGRIRAEWGPKLIPWTGGLMIATVPANYAIDFLKIAPKGHLTILASFLLFAIGVAFALNRHRWLGEEKGMQEAEATA